MLFARIVASSPSAARYVARTLHEAGYEVEIVPPGTAHNPAAEVVFDVDADKTISLPAEHHAAGEREFVFKPLWRKFTAKRKADEDVARAMCAYPRRFGIRTEPAPAERLAATASAIAPPLPPESEPELMHRAAAEAAMWAEKRIAAEERQRLAAEERRRAEADADHRAKETERLQLEELNVRQEQDAARQHELEAQRAELRRQQQVRELEFARQREREEREMIVRKQEEERQRAEALVREAEWKAQAEAAYQRRLEDEGAETLRRDTMQRHAEEARRNDVMRQRHDEETVRKAEAQRLLLEANMRREESARQRDSAVLAAPEQVPTIGRYLALRFAQWREGRATKSRSKVTRIDGAGRSAWRQAWPVTVGVAAACLIGWGIASYRDSPPAAATQGQPPILSPGQYAPYPVASAAAAPAVSRTAHKGKRRAVRSSNTAQDEVIVHRYYPAKGATAQNRNPQRPKKITDLQ